MTGSLQLQPYLLTSGYAGPASPPPPPPPPGFSVGAAAFDGSQATGAVLTRDNFICTDSGLLSFGYWLWYPAPVPSFGFAVAWVSDPVNNYNNFVSIGTDGVTSIVFFVSNNGANTSHADAGPSPTSSGTWLWHGGCADQTHGSGSNILRQWINDTEITPTAYQDHGPLNIALSGLPFVIGNDTIGDCGAIYLAEPWIAPNQFVDFSDVANRRKFISAAGKPTDLGADGSAPTGTPPAFYGHIASGGNPADLAVDRSGNGNNMTITGTLTLAPSSPSD